MNRANQSFISTENRGSRQDYGGYPMVRPNNQQIVFPPPPPHLPRVDPPNPRGVVPEPWRAFQERTTSGPLGVASFPGQRNYPHQIIYVGNDATRNTYQPSPSFQGRWNVQVPEEESRLTQDEQKQTLNKLKREVYFPMPKRAKKPNLYFREYSINNFSENGKGNDEDGKRCAICLEDFEPREVVTVTPCKHMFHEECIIPWVKNQGRCPVCRYAFCERLREHAAPLNNLTPVEQYEIELISIIRAMEDAFISENIRVLH